VPRLNLKRVAEEQLAALPGHVREDIQSALLRIQANPTEVGTPLLGRLSGRWRARVGGYRIVYRIRDGGRLVVVDAIRTRGRSY
jgi:mRNA-degrading endonuclease RelE of RelBE toxin-antitoxin system